jgi:hypothetical protein
MDGANGQTGGKNSSSPFVLTAFISFGLLIFSSIGWDTIQCTLQFPAAVCNRRESVRDTSDVKVS